MEESPEERGLRRPAGGWDGVLGFPQSLLLSWVGERHGQRGGCHSLTPDTELVAVEALGERGGGGEWVRVVGLTPAVTSVCLLHADRVPGTQGRLEGPQTLGGPPPPSASLAAAPAQAVRRGVWQGQPPALCKLLSVAHPAGALSLLGLGS